MLSTNVLLHFSNCISIPLNVFHAVLCVSLLSPVFTSKFSTTLSRHLHLHLTGCYSSYSLMLRRRLALSLSFFLFDCMDGAYHLTKSPKCIQCSWTSEFVVDRCWTKGRSTPVFLLVMFSGQPQDLLPS